MKNRSPRMSPGYSSAMLQERVSKRINYPKGIKSRTAMDFYSKRTSQNHRASTQLTDVTTHDYQISSAAQPKRVNFYDR